MRLLLSLLALTTVATAPQALAKCGKAGSTSSCVTKVAIGQPESTTEEKHGWCVECEEVSIPHVVCPWGKGGSGLTCFDWLRKKRSDTTCGNPCCANAGEVACCATSRCGPVRCGEVKCVRKLKKKTYEVDACEWKWEIRRLPPCCGCKAGSCCCERGSSSQSCHTNCADEVEVPCQ